jgi:phage shock protein PspC (stress-responsive transcriptional regulator)
VADVRTGGWNVFVPHVVVPHRRCAGQKKTPRQKLTALLTTMLGAGISAGVGAGFAGRLHHDDTVVLLCIVVGAAFVTGIVAARLIGGRKQG